MSLPNALTYSLVEHLRNQVTEVAEVVYVYDGIELSGRTKPFLTVQLMTEGNSLITAGLRDYEEIYRWQVGIFARNIAERTRLQGTVKDVLRQRNIPLYDTRQPAPFPQVGVFVLRVMNGTPMPIDNAESETYRHRFYFDVECELYRVNGEFTFNQ